MAEEPSLLPSLSCDEASCDNSGAADNGCTCPVDARFACICGNKNNTISRQNNNQPTVADDDSGGSADTAAPAAGNRTCSSNSQLSDSRANVLVITITLLKIEQVILSWEIFKIEN